MRCFSSCFTLTVLIVHCATTVRTNHAADINARPDVVVFDFETSYDAWSVEGTAFGSEPVTKPIDGQMPVRGVIGQGAANSFVHGDPATGILTSPEFKVERDHLAFLIGGGRIPDQLGIELLFNGQRVRFSTGHESEGMKWDSWDVRDLAGKMVRVRIIDRAVGGWGHILIDQVIQTDVSRRVITVDRLSSYRRSNDYYREPFRPQYHFTPEMNWMNDPNGLVYFEGEYHLFYQHNPHGNEWGHMSWGHAVSDDLFHWRHLPIALHDEHNVMAFSGSAVVDRRNTSGFGIGQLPPLVAIYTGHSAGLQTQDLAFSNDRGRTWTKYENNPVLDIGKADFRDPKVFWYAPQQCWIMVVSLATELKVQFYVSTNLRDWTLLSEFGPAGVANKPNWECPDLFELPIENENGAKRWVLEVDIGSGSIAGGSGGEYFTGVFDGKQFLADSKDSQWVDYGRDFYAPVSYADIPESDGRRIWIGWMNNWETSLNPTSPWRGAMSIPRQLTLRRINGLLKLCQRPVHEVNSLRTSTERLKPKQLNNSDELLSTAGNQVELTLAFKPGTASEFGVRVLKGAGCQTEIGYDMKTNAMFVDRTKSGNVDFHPAFAGRHSGPMTVDESGLVRMRIFVDTCSVEAFGNYGETVITDLVFPDPRAIGIELFARGGSCQLVEGSVHSIGTTMRKP